MIKQTVQNLIKEAAAKAGYDVPAVFSLDVPPKKEFGDFATNVALMISQQFPELLPRNIADDIVIQLAKSDIVEKADVAGPGFINIILRNTFYLDELGQLIKLGENYGKSNIGKNKKVNVEYVSANPTGPLHIGNARGGPIGQAIANLFEFLGYDVAEEFYVNDIGGQVDRLAESLFYWYEKKLDNRAVFPENGYPGEYVEELSLLIQKEKSDEIREIKGREELIEFFKKEGLYHLVKKMREDCQLLGIEFDVWSNQSDFEHSGKTDHIINKLEEAGATTKKEGALWFKRPDDPELADRESVLKKSDEDKSYTYFADDIAYHIDKFDRGFDRLINVWGSNHHGHVPRLKAAISALGYPADKLEILLYQYVRLKNADRVFRMAKREGTIVTLREVLDAGVAPDAFKYFILSQNPNTPFDFDIALAADTSEKNPVYYIKYAHARIASILRKASHLENEGRKTEDGWGSGASLDLQNADLKLLTHQKERELVKELLNFPELLLRIHSDYQIQALPHYAYKIAGLFHDFYSNCQVLSDDKELTRARLSLILATKWVLANSLSILGIKAPERM